MKAWLLLACVLSQGAWALAPCQRDTAVGNWCEIGIDALHPTQGASARSRSMKPRPHWLA